MWGTKFYILFFEKINLVTMVKLFFDGARISIRNRNSIHRISGAPLKGQAHQGTSLFTSADFYDPDRGPWPSAESPATTVLVFVKVFETIMSPSSSPSSVKNEEDISNAFLAKSHGLLLGLATVPSLSLGPFLSDHAKKAPSLETFKS